MSDFVTESSLLKRAYIFLEDGEWENANEYFEKVLDGNPENPDAYLGKLLAEVRVHSLEELAGCAIDYTESVNYKRLMRYGDQTVRAKVNAYVQNIAYNAENARKDGILKNVANSLNNSASWRKADFDRAMELLKSVGDYKNAKELIAMCEAKYAERVVAAGEEQKDRIYKNIADSMKDMSTWNVEKYDQAIEVLKKFGGYKQSVQLFKELEVKKADYIRMQEKKQEELTQYKKESSKNIVKFLIIGTIVVAILVAAGFLVYKIFFEKQYDRTTSLNICYNYAIGLNADGTVVAVGDNTFGQCDVEDWEKIISVVSSDFHSVGLKADGTVVTTGDNTYGQCDVEYWDDIVQVSVGSSHTVGLRKDGKVEAEGDNTYEQCDVHMWEDIVQVSANSEYTVGLKSDGTVVATGSNNFKQCDVEYWDDVVHVATGFSHTVALKSDGTVVATGDNIYGQCDVSGWRNIVAVYAGVHNTVGLTSDGTVVVAGSDSYNQHTAANWSDISEIYIGYHYIAGVKNDGSVVITEFDSYLPYMSQNILSVGSTVKDWTDIKVDKR